MMEVDPGAFTTVSAILKVAVPSIVLYAAPTATSTVQTFLLGRYGHASYLAAFAAVGITANALASVFNFLADGVAAKVGKSVGQRQWQQFASRVKLALLCAIGAGTLASSLLAAVKPLVLQRLLRLEPSVLAVAAPYWGCRVALLPLALLNTAIVGILQGYKRVNLSAALVSAAAVLEMGLSAAVLAGGGLGWAGLGRVAGLTGMGLCQLAAACTASAVGLACVVLLPPPEVPPEHRLLHALAWGGAANDPLRQPLLGGGESGGGQGGGESQGWVVVKWPVVEGQDDELVETGAVAGAVDGPVQPTGGGRGGTDGLVQQVGGADGGAGAQQGGDESRSNGGGVRWAALDEQECAGGASGSGMSGVAQGPEGAEAPPEPDHLQGASQGKEGGGSGSSSGSGSGARQCTGQPPRRRGSLASLASLAQGEDFWDFVRDGANMLVRSVCLQATFFIGMVTAGRLGSASLPAQYVLAAHAIVNQLWLITVYVVDGFAAAAIVLGSRLCGRMHSGDVEAIRCFHVLAVKTLALGLACGAAAGGAFWGWRHEVVAFFTADPDTRRALSRPLWALLCAAQPLNALVFVYDGHMLAGQAFGYIRTSMLLGTLAVFLPTLAGLFTTLHTLTAVWGAKAALNVWRLATGAYFVHVRCRPARLRASMPHPEGQA